MLFVLLGVGAGATSVHVALPGCCTFQIAPTGSPEGGAHSPPSGDPPTGALTKRPMLCELLGVGGGVTCCHSSEPIGCSVQIAEASGTTPQRT